MGDEKAPAGELRVAALVQSGDVQRGAVERAAGVWESRGVGNSYLVTTPEGDVLVNAGTLADARKGRERFAAISSNPIRCIVLTQSHANQYGGLEVYKTPDNTVIAHRLYPQDRAYSDALSAHYRRGSRRIFGAITGRTEDLVPTVEVSPDLLIGDEGHRFTLGGRRFEIIWTPGGETRSAVIVWLPDERIAIVGNLFGPLFGNYPNLNTLRGDKPRSAAEFIDSAKTLRALQPRLILTGHEVIEGDDRIAQELTRTIDAVQWVLDQTIKGMNDGIVLSQLMQLQPPAELRLTEEYGKLAWNVRAIWHEYTGWFDPARGTTELYGVPVSSIAVALAELAGGVDRLIERAAAFVSESQPLEALHMLELALAAAPASAFARAVKFDALSLLDAQATSNNLWEKRWIAAELRELEPGTRPE